MVDFWNRILLLGWVPPAHGGQVPGSINKRERLELQASIDVLVARDLFGIERDEMSSILETFPVVKERNEKEFGDFRTRTEILARYELAEADL